MLNFVKSSRLFLYLGFRLIFLALICLPVKVRYVVQPEAMELDTFYIGLILALMVGVWGLASLVLGIVESSMSKTTALPCLLSILCFVNIGSASLLWMQTFIFGGLSAAGWIWLGSLLLPPTLIMNLTGPFFI